MTNQEKTNAHAFMSYKNIILLNYPKNNNKNKKNKRIFGHLLLKILKQQHI